MAAVPTAALDLLNGVRFRLVFLREAMTQSKPDEFASFSPEATAGLGLILMDCETSIEKAEHLIDA